MTDYATGKVEEAFDCTMVSMITRRSAICQGLLNTKVKMQDFGAWDDYIANLENMDQMHSSIILCMKKHLTPDPMTQFSYVCKIGFLPPRRCSGLLSKYAGQQCIFKALLRPSLLAPW